MLLTLFSIVSYGQTRTIRGIALDKGGDPIPGCNVLIKGTPNGTATDVCGEFSLTTDQPSPTIVFHCQMNDFRVFETVVKDSDFNEGDKLIFQLRGHWKMKSKDCKKTIDRQLKTYKIN